MSALQTIHRCLDSIITYFGQDNTPKGAGIGKKVATEDFIKTTAFLVDVIPVVNRLSEYFQKRDIDVSFVPLAVQKCLADLNAMKIEDTVHERSLPGDLEKKNGRLEYKGQVITKSKKAPRTVKVDFIDCLVNNIQQR